MTDSILTVANISLGPSQRDYATTVHWLDREFHLVRIGTGPRNSPATGPTPPTPSLCPVSEMPVPPVGTTAILPR